MTVEECFHLGVKALMENQEGKVLLLEKHHRTRGVYWDLPGGRMQKGETELDALKREVEEETGFMVADAVPFDMLLTPVRIPTLIGEVGLIIAVYHCLVKESFVPRLSSEHQAFDWFPFSEVAEHMKGQYALPFIEKLRSRAKPSL